LCVEFISPLLLLLLLLVLTEPEGYHFGAANGVGLAVWRSTDDDDADVIDQTTDMDKIAFGFMTWQSNTSLLHYSSNSSADVLHVKLVSLISHLSSL